MDNTMDNSYRTMQTLQRTFIPGDDWLYFKIYSGPKTADTILTEIICPITEALIEQKKISKWFFIRYADPKQHIRLRFLLTNTQYVSDVTLLLNQHIKPFIEQNIVWKVQTDTYQRELERYGMNTIEDSETLFFHDSVMVVDMMGMIDGDEGEVIRWKFGLRAIDALLDDFGYSINDKMRLMESLKTSFGNEFGMDKNLKFQLDKKFRDERPEISKILDRNNDETSEILPLFQLLEARSEKNKPLAHKIIALKNEGKLELELNNLLSSYIHMLCNRLFKSKQRVHELVVYDFLYRHYQSGVARGKYGKK